MNALLLLLLCALAQAPATGRTGTRTPPGARERTPSRPTAAAPARTVPRGDPVRGSGAGAHPTAIHAGPEVDSAPAVQAYIDAALAVTDKDKHAGRTVFLPESAAVYGFEAPVYIDGEGITVRGGGVGTRVAGRNGYGGPVFVPGVRRLERMGMDPAEFRVASPAGGLGLSTRKKVYLIASAHPAQLGGGVKTASLVPDYWTAPAYCWEFLLRLPTAPESSAGLFGLVQGDGGGPCPWSWRGGHDPGDIMLWFRTPEQAANQYRRDHFRFPYDGRWHRVTYQLDLEAGRADAWVDGVAARVTRTSTDGTPVKPGLRLARHDGTVPFTVGTGGGGAAGLTATDLGGLNVTRGLKYKHGTPAEARLDGAAVNDSRFTEVMHGWGKGPDTVFCLALDDKPATHVRLRSQTGTGVGFWLTPTPRPSGNLRFENLTMTTGIQAPLAVGHVFGLDLIDVDAGRNSLQGVGSIPIACTYMVTMDRCKFGGLDCAYFGFQQMVRATNTQIPQTGRDGVRCKGGDFQWRNSFFSFNLESTETYFRSVANGYGGLFTVEDAQIDNENGGPKVAAIDIEQSPYCPNRTVLDRVSVSTLASPTFVRFTGFRTAAGQNTYPVGKIDARNLVVFSGYKGPGITINGRGSWYGTFDPNGLSHAKVAGDTEDLKVLPLVVTTPAP